MNQQSVGIVGLGYVGLPLAMEFCQKGFHVYGVDTDPDKVASLRAGRSYVGDVEDALLSRYTATGHLEVSTSPDGLRNAAAISVCVPTPLTKTKDPDMSCVVRGMETIAEILEPGQVIILESTVYPGATEELVAPVLEKSGLVLDSDFFLAFSPERVDPGNREYRLSEIPKIVGGVSSESTERAAEIYGRVFKTIIRMTAKEAEMAKLLENTFRAVNIGLINELALVAHKMGVNIWNVIEAAKTKPFGFMPFYPGPGLGGHCIPIDPFYLSWKARAYRADTSFIELADRVNSRMPDYVVERLAALLNQEKKPVRGSKILVLGVTYKRDVADLRESPALDVIGLLLQKGARVSYNDPAVPRLLIFGQPLDSKPLSQELLKEQDCVLVIADHSSYNWKFICRNARLVFDTRNATRNVQTRRANVHTL